MIYIYIISLIYNIYSITYIYIYLPTHPLGQDRTQGKFLSGV